MNKAAHIVHHALAHTYAVGAFNITNMEVLQGVCEAAVAEEAPVFICVTEGALRYGLMEFYIGMMEAARSAYPTLVAALHMDHITSVDLCLQGIEQGFDSVMFDGSALPYVENVRKTKEVVSIANKWGVQVEAELGRIIGEEDLVRVDTEDEMFTDPQQAKDFLNQTGCHSLAVAVGTAHGLEKFHGSPHIDLDRLQKIAHTIPNTPLVLHGASSIPPSLVAHINAEGGSLEGAKRMPDELLRKAINLHICKVNTDSDLRLAFTSGLRSHLNQHPEVVDLRKYLGKAREAVKEEAQRKIRLLGGSGRAEEIRHTLRKESK